MTVFGKILVFLNLVASVAVAAFIIMVFVARTNWAAGFEEYKKRYSALEASYRTVQEDASKDAEKASSAKLEQDKQISGLTKELAVEKVARQKAAADLLAEQKKAASETASKVSLEADLQRHREEVSRLAQATKMKDEQILKLTQDKNELRDEKVQAVIEKNRLDVRVTQLSDQLKDLTRDNDRLRKGGSSDSVAERARDNPPPGNVEGVIKQTDPSGLVTISLGSDAGLLKGHTLDVFRLNPAPEFLGSVRLTDVRAHEAVGQLLKRGRSPVRAGDRVGTLNPKS